MIYTLLQDTIALIKQRMREEVHVSTKSSFKDLVTNVDKEVEQFITKRLKELYPTSQILGEETQQTVNLQEGDIWIIDPIDGTTNFVKQGDEFGILLAHFIDGIGREAFMVDVMKNKIFYAKKDEGVWLNNEPFTMNYESELNSALISFSPHFIFKIKDGRQLIRSANGTRYYGACSIDGILVVENKLGAFMIDAPNPWDIASILIFARELGLVTLNFDGTEKQLNSTTPFIFGQEKVVKKMLEFV